MWMNLNIAERWSYQIPLKASLLSEQYINNDIDGSYVSIDAKCSGTNTMNFTYNLDSGHSGTIRLELQSSSRINGIYKDFGRGDEGVVVLFPII